MIKNKMQNELYTQTAQETISSLDSNAGTGLSTQAATEKITHYGYNEIPEKNRAMSKNL